MVAELSFWFRLSLTQGKRASMGAEEKGPAGTGATDDAEQLIARTGTYRSLGEQKLSPQEERFERGRRTVGLFLAPR